MIQAAARQRTGIIYLQRYWLAFLLVVLLAVPLVASRFWVQVLVFAAINVIIALGLNLLLGYTGQPSFGHAAFYGIGAYTSAILTTRVGISPWLGFAASIIVTGIIGYLIGLPILRLKGHYLAMATLAVGESAAIIFVQYKDLTKGVDGIGAIPPLSIGNFAFDTNFKFYYLAWFCTAVLIFLSHRLVNSRVGRALRAIRGNEIAAESFGIDVAKYKVQIFAISAIYGGIAGTLYAHFVTFISPESFSLTVSAFAVVMVVVGGIGTIGGAVVGGVFLTMLPEALRAWKDYNQLIYAILLIFVLVFLPGGIYGLAGRTWQRWRQTEEDDSNGNA